MCSISWELNWLKSIPASLILKNGISEIFECKYVSKRNFKPETYYGIELVSNGT